MKKLYTLILLNLPLIGIAQLNLPTGSVITSTPTWTVNSNKAPGDSCGAYFNNYVGINKTFNLREEPMRRGSAFPNDGFYSGRAQRFVAPQPVEVSGVEFYAYIKNNPTQDSLMVITSLNEFDAVADSVGLEIDRDTVYVTYHAFTANLPFLSTKSYFNQSYTMTTDFVVSIFTPTDDSLFIMANDPNTFEGNGENLGFAQYNNPTPGYESYIGWYNVFNGDLGASYDYDYLIAPLVKYDIHQSFNVLNDTICPTGNGCVDSYNQVPNFTANQYNSNYTNSTSSIRWYWDDGTFNAGLTSACHTYNNAGTYNVNLQDTLYKFDYNNNYCLVDITKSIVALDTVVPDFTFIQTNVVVDFTNTSSFADSVWWDFGDSTAAGNMNTVSHTYDSIATFNVWLHVYNQCTEDSIMYTVTTDDVGINEFENLISIYPNPAQNNVYVKNIPSNATLGIYNIVGEKIIEIQSTSNQVEINTNQFANGTYFVKINTNIQSITKKLVVRH